MKGLKEFWDNKVHKEHKHFTEEMSKEKMTRQKDLFKDNVLSRIELLENMSALDWGCGGGLIANELCNVVKKVYVTDISEESVKEAIRYTECNVEGIVNPYSGHEWSKFNIDILTCYAVIWHMPGLDYFETAIDIWAEEIKPEYIAIQVKEILSDSECASVEHTESDYFKEGAYLTGLLLRKDKVLSLFETKNYFLKHYKTSKTVGGVTLGHYLFKK